MRGRYLLKKSSGFAFSEETESNYRKQNLYTFKAGSTFSKTYNGQICDVKPSDDFLIQSGIMLNPYSIYWRNPNEDKI